MKEYAIIVAGGSGTRMNLTTPKQFLPIDGLPILMHTINAFFNYSSNINLILVLPKDQIDTWKSLCKEFNFEARYSLAIGGDSRFQSVKNGLAIIDQPEEALVAIHDGVRPLINKAIIAKTYEKAAIHGNAVTAVQPKDSVRILGTDGSKALDRSKLRLIQTPQTFTLSILRKAYALKEESFHTDDASVVESLGEEIFLIEGSYENLKITTPEDLEFAEMILKRKN